jgi:hypothetical protein
VLRYFDECSDYKRLEPRTRTARRQLLEATFDEPLKPGSYKGFADVPLARMTANAVEILRDRKLATEQAANARLCELHCVTGCDLSRAERIIESRRVARVSARFPLLMAAVAAVLTGAALLVRVRRLCRLPYDLWKLFPDTGSRHTRYCVEFK